MLIQYKSVQSNTNHHHIHFMSIRWQILLWGLFWSLCCGWACDPVSQASNEDANINIILAPPTGGMNMPSDPLESNDMMIEEADQLFVGPTLNSILPSRAPLEGGIWIRIIGTDFRDPMQVNIADQRCVELEWVNDTMVRCLIPAWPTADSVDVSIAWATEGGTRVLTQALTYYIPLTVTSIDPSRGSANGNTEVTIRGEGFLDPSDVRFNQTPAISVEVISDQELKVITPAGTAGLADVTVRNQNGGDEIRAGYRWQTPMAIERIEPNWAWVDEAFDFTLYGYGLLEDSVLDIEGNQLNRLEVTPPYRITGQAQIPQAGWRSIQVSNGNGNWSINNGILLLDPNERDFQVYGLTPQRLPSDLGGYFMIGGAGFDESVSITLADEVISCSLEDANRLRCFTPTHPNGDVQVRIQKDGIIFEQTLSFYTQLEVYQLSPNRASISGGALIKVTGRGFTPRLEFDFDGLPVSLNRWVSPEEIWIQVPPHAPGMVDVNSRQESESVYLPQALEYFDPTSRYGGVWGEPIHHSLNVTVLNIYDFSPIPNVQITGYPFAEGNDAPLVTGLTNDSGQVTLSRPYLDSPLNVTAFKEGFEIYTIERVVSENVTLLLFPFEPPSSGEGTGEPIEPVTLHGEVLGIEDLPKPLEPGFSLRVFVDVSHSSMLNRSSNPVPNINSILTENGPFSIVTRPGQMSVIVTAAYVSDTLFDMYRNGVLSYWYMRRSMRPIAMGMLRYLSLSPGAEVSGLQVHVNLPMSTSAPIHLVNPPQTNIDINNDGTDAEDMETGGMEANEMEGNEMEADEMEADEMISIPYQVRAFLNLGPDGYWELDTFLEGSSHRMTMNYLPDLEFFPNDITLEWQGTVILDPNYTQTYVFHEQTENIEQGVRLAPIVSAPKMILNASNPPLLPTEDGVSNDMAGNSNPNQRIEVQSGDFIRWQWRAGVEQDLTEPPEATIVRLTQGGLPIWSYTLPGGIQELQLNSTASGGLIPAGEYQVYLQPLITAPGLNYQDYDLIDLNNLQSYTLHRQVIRLLP